MSMIKASTLEEGGSRRESNASTLVEASAEEKVEERHKQSPKEWSRAHKILHISITSAGAFLVSWSASLYLSVAPAVAQDFGVNQTESRLPFTFYIIAWAAGPLLLSPFSDYYGRKCIFFYSILLWTIFHIGAATSDNLAALILTRFFASFFGSAQIVLGGAVAVDIFEGVDTARFYSVNIANIWWGPVVGPLIGGFIATYSQPSVSRFGGWRWAMWATVIAGSIQVILLATLSETHPVLVEQCPPSTKYLLFQGKNPATLKQSSPGRRIAAIASQATSMIVSEPIILFISLWQSTVFGIVYMFFSAFPVVFGDIYGFKDYQIGLSFLGILVGLLLYILYDFNIGVVLLGNKIKEKGPCPEYRAVPAIISGACIVVSLFLFAGLARPSIHWIGPIAASALYGFGAVGVVLSTFGYLLDTYRPCMPAASAATSVIRSAITAFCPLYGDVFFRKVGVQNASIILACIAVLELGIPVIAILYGQKIRSMSTRAAK